MEPASITTDRGFREGLVALMSRRTTVRAIAVETGLSKTTVGELRRCNRTPTLDVVRRLSRSYAPDAAAWERAWRRVYLAPGRPVPRQLPPDVEFIGRAAELAALERLLEAGADRHEPLMIAVTGTAGVGKTALVTHWGHRAQERFGHGTLYLDLQGYDPADPLTSADALAALLQSLPVPAAEIPDDLTARVARFRSELHERRMLVVLDNAFNAEHVRLLLSGSPTCTTVVTSRDDLAGLRDRYDAKTIALQALPLDEATRLLGALLDRPPSGWSTGYPTAHSARRPAPAPGDPSTSTTIGTGTGTADLAALARQVAQLPLGLRLAAGWVRDTSADGSIPDLDGLDGPARLDILDGADARTSMRAVLSWSYRHLAPATARTFRLLGLHPGRDADLLAVAALTGQEPGPAARQLRDLARAAMVRTPGRPNRAGTARVELHDLLRAYAREVAERQDGERERNEALTRLLDHYCRTADAAATTLDPRRRRLPAVWTEQVPLRAAVGEPDQARAWLEAEQANLVSAVGFAVRSGRPGHAGHLAASLGPFLNAAGRYLDGVQVHEWARAAARGTGDRPAEASALEHLAVARQLMASWDDVFRCLSEALAIREELADVAGAGRTLGLLGTAFARIGRLREAEAHLTRALAAAEAAGDLPEQAGVLNDLGLVLKEQGRDADALPYLRATSGLAGHLGNRHLEAIARGTAALVLKQLGRTEEAEAEAEAARALGEPAGVDHAR